MEKTGLSSVYLISGCKAGTTFQYRVLHKQEQLERFDIRTTVREGLAGRDGMLEEISNHDLLYLYRVAYGPFVERLIKGAREQGIPVVFGVDDLVFEPDLVHWVDPVKAMSQQEALGYYEGVWRYRQTLLSSDYVVTSTEYLAELVQTLGQTAFVHRNGVSRWMIEEADGLWEQRQRDPVRDQVVIGYGSGTNTHRKDLGEIAEALATIMTRHPQVELRIVGPMEVPDSLKRFEGHIKHQPLVPWRKWLSVLNTFDVNLAPLESGNPFCEAKSEIKYTEAALVGIPTVASRIRAYEVAMQDGETGFLAGTADEWIEKVEALVTDSGLRRRMGEASRADVLAHYTPEVLSEELMGTLTTIQDQYAQRKAAALATARSSFKTPLILNWVFPEPIPGSGGHMDIIRMINLLSSFGHHNRAYVVPRISLWDKSDLEIRDAVRRQFGPLRADLYKWDGGLMDESDGVILTHWTTAHMIEEVRNSSKVFYFVQDWEPFFFPMSDQYLRAEQTYKMGFSCITLGPWLTERLTSWYDADADYFDFAVDHEIFYPRPVKRPERPRVCFYARPSTPRRLFPMGVQALELVHEKRPEAEIVFYGVDDDELRRHDVPFPHTNRGILNEEELAELFSSCDLGIVLSSTNCSLVPPEMMACRCAVVDLDRETVKGVLEHRVNAMLAEPTPEGIAEAVVSLLDDDSLRMELVEKAYEQVQERSWVKSARKVERILYQKLPASRRALERRQWKASPALPASKDLPAMQRGLLDAIHKTRRKTVARWRAGAKGWAVRLTGGNRGIVLNGKAVYTVGELTGGRSIGQSFVARHDNLHRIDLLVGTYGRRNTRDVILHLKESPEASHALATVHLNAALLADGAYARFVFEPQPDSSGRSYYLCVESPESVPGDAITLWAYRRVDLADARLHKDGRISAGQLVFGLFYVDEQLGEVGERPLLQGWTPAGALLWRRMEKGARLLAKGELNRLRQEVADYWAWRSGRT